MIKNFNLKPNKVSSIFFFFSFWEISQIVVFLCLVEVYINVYWFVIGISSLIGMAFFVCFGLVWRVAFLSLSRCHVVTDVTMSRALSCRSLCPLPWGLWEGSGHARLPPLRHGFLWGEPTGCGRAGRSRPQSAPRIGGAPLPAACQRPSLRAWWRKKWFLERAVGSSRRGWPEWGASWCDRC